MTQFQGLSCVHLHHESFTGIHLEKEINLSGYASAPRDLVIEVKMAGNVQSPVGIGSRFYSEAGISVKLISVKLLDNSELIAYEITKAWSTSTYPLKYQDFLRILKDPQKT